jgi:hypothetical protein
MSPAAMPGSRASSDRDAAVACIGLSFEPIPVDFSWLGRYVGFGRCRRYA